MNKVIIGLIISCVFIVNCETSHKKVESSNGGSPSEVVSATPVNSSAGSGGASGSEGTFGSGGEGGGK